VASAWVASSGNDFPVESSFVRKRRWTSSISCSPAFNRDEFDCCLWDASSGDLSKFVEEKRTEVDINAVLRPTIPVV
jgi:hypothetical protein